MSKPLRPTWATVNLDALWQNYTTFKTASNKDLIPVIKADAYGHGAKIVYRFLYEKGLRYFAVSLVEEALELRALGLDTDILVMGACLADQLELIHAHNLVMTVYDLEMLKHVMAWKKPLRFHLKIDSGMRRYGLSPSFETHQIISEIINYPHLKFEGIYSHFATADLDDDFYQKQLDVFSSFVSDLSIKPPMIHLSNSSSIHKHEKTFDFTTHARLGISLYGLSLDESHPPLIPVMSLMSRIVQIQSLNPGDGLGYGQTYQAKSHERIGLIPIGYADGWIRKNKHHDVLINDKRYALVGNICMDTSFVKIDSSIQKGDTVILFGSSLSVDEVAMRLETIHYEILTTITKRVPRIYIKDGQTYDPC